MALNTNKRHKDEHRQRRVEQDIRNAIASLTRHLTALGKSAELLPSDQGGVRVGIITMMTGNNKGAAMKVDGTAVGQVAEETRRNGMLVGDEKSPVRAYTTNSNYQALNNSVLLGGSCATEDPGVHISFLDFEKEEEKGVVERIDQEKKH